MDTVALPSNARKGTLSKGTLSELTYTTPSKAGEFPRPPGGYPLQRP